MTICMRFGGQQRSEMLGWSLDELEETFDDLIDFEKEFRKATPDEDDRRRADLSGKEADNS